MNAKNILCPVDFSHTGDEALKYASTLARENDACMHLVHIYEPPMAYTDAQDGFVPPPDEGPLRQMLDQLKPTDDSVSFCREFIVGHAPDSLLEYARTHDIDLIVMGTHGRTGLNRLLMGSVAEAIVRRAPCPVLTIRATLGKHDEAKS